MELAKSSSMCLEGMLGEAAAGASHGCGAGVGVWLEVFLGHAFVAS